MCRHISLFIRKKIIEQTRSHKNKRTERSINKPVLKICPLDQVCTKDWYETTVVE